MASGKTLELQEFDRLQEWRATPLPKKVKRDRALRGKARRKMRKHDNKIVPNVEVSDV